ncbi:MAG: DinB family protein [Acidobacteriia bacterium]|nr:DinB family protein [Terriglobia bacterium]
MTVEDLEVLFDYGYWANKQLFGVLSQLSAEEFTQPVAGSYGSVRNTMVHILSAEWGWLDRCGGTRRGAALDASDYPTLASLVERWQQVEGYVREFVSTLRDEDLDRIVEFAIGSGPKQAMRLGELMHHAANHAVHHRGQVALLLRILGYVPGNFDILVYYPRSRRT